MLTTGTRGDCKLESTPKTKLFEANYHFRTGNYATALSLYDEAIAENQDIEKIATYNKEITISRLRKKISAIQLIPVDGLQVDELDGSTWVSTNYDPHFELCFSGKRNLEAGWYRVSLLIETKNKKNIAKFYPNYGNGYSEASSITLPFLSKKFNSRFVYFSDNVYTLRFDPNEVKGNFKILYFDIKKETEESATRNIFSVIAKNKGEGSNLEQHELQKNIRSAAEGLNISYLEFLKQEYEKLFQHTPGQLSYEEWIENVEAATLPSAVEASLLYEQLAYKPLISVVTPTYNTDEIFLRACIDSVIAQSYPNWELCIADDASSQPHVRQILEDYAARDIRIKAVFREKNGHISHASNSALTLANGDYVALLDHDDALPEHALLFVAQAINAHPDSQVLYSDEDKIKADGQRFDPHFKSDWNPDLFYSQNYVSHLGVYKRALLEKVGGFRPGVEGSQDYDLLLRCLPHVKAQQIIHIPRVLYHWRTVEGSTALSAGEKSYTTIAGIKALTDYFANVNPEVRIHPGLVPNTYRVHWPIPDPAPLVSLLIPTRDRCNLVEVAVRSILKKSTYTYYEILILDNGSVEPDTLSFFKQIQKEDPRVRVLRYDHPFNYSAINNFGVRHAKGEIIGLINNDIEVISPEWLSEMVSHAVRPEIGCVGAKLYYNNDTIQHAGVICSLGGVAGHSHKHFPRKHPGYFYRLTLTQTLSAVTAACLLIRRHVYEEVGGLDEEHLKVAFNDVDFCLKVGSAGYRNIWTPHAELYHYESVSRGHEDTPEKQNRFRLEIEVMKKRWGPRLMFDPYYNSNLTKSREDFSIEFANNVTF